MFLFVYIFVLSFIIHFTICYKYMLGLFRNISFEILQFNDSSRCFVHYITPSISLLSLL